jgi:LPXTG-site transpeptidase (sortase) family protein
MKNKKVIILRVVVVICIIAGIAMIGYPVYTNFVASRGMSQELTQWEEQAGDPAAGEASPAEESGTPEVSETAQEETENIEDDPVMDLGQDGVAPETESGLTAEDFFPLKITIPRIELEYVVFEGTHWTILRKGAGHETVTPLPGQEGRCTISGHRTTYGAPFNRVDELIQGDLIYLETLDDRTYIYKVTSLEVVKPTDVWILEGTEKEELLLTTCHPKYSAASRLIVISELVELIPFGLKT